MLVDSNKLTFSKERTLIAWNLPFNFKGEGDIRFGWDSSLIWFTITDLIFQTTLSKLWPLTRWTEMGQWPKFSRLTLKNEFSDRKSY